jgi:hypothetical protein
MPPLASFIVMSVGSVVAVFGLVLLLTMLTRNPRAKQTLIVCGHEWRLRTLAIFVGLAGSLCLGLPWVYAPAESVNGTSDMADRPRSHDDDRHVSPNHDYERLVPHSGVRIVTGESAEMDQPGSRQSGASEEPSPDGPLNLTGEWRITNTILETSYQPYRHLRLGFRLAVHQDGPAFTGEGEKYLENGRTIPVAARRPIRIQGRIRQGSVIDATFQEEGRSRHIQGHFRLTQQDRQQLTGTFVSTAANARGSSQWIRASARPGVSASRREQNSREGRVSSPPPEQDAPPVIALVAPVQGQQVATAQIQVSGTATGAPSIARVDIQVNGERRVRRTPPGQTTVDFSEPLALRHGPNEIEVTAFDQQHRSARQRVTVTRIEEGAVSSAPADEPRHPAPADPRTALRSRPSLQLGMSQAEVRALLGEPLGVEDTPVFVFWNYGTEAYVVFDQVTGRVHGWLGVSS